jgi:hypothetical protein
MCSGGCKRRCNDGTLVGRDRGTPQGSAISPVLANLFLHYALDAWMRRVFPSVLFERYADDVIAHCVSEQQAVAVRDAVAARMSECGLELHPDKTRMSTASRTAGVVCMSTPRLISSAIRFGPGWSRAGLAIVLSVYACGQ